MRHVQRPNQLLQLLFWTKNKILKAKEPEGLLDVDRRQPKAKPFICRWTLTHIASFEFLKFRSENTLF